MSTRLITEWFCRDRQSSGEEFSKIKQTETEINSAVKQ